MAFSDEVASAFARVGEEIKDIQGGGSRWNLGPLANASLRYQERAKAASTSALKLVVLSDSTSDGYIGGATNQGSTEWADVWPGRLTRTLRQQIGLPTGGDGWIPPSTPLFNEGYSYRPTILRPEEYTGRDRLNAQIGIPGALWLQQAHATNVFDVEYPLSPGTTSIDIITTRNDAGGVGIIPANGEPMVVSGVATRDFTRVYNPGASVRIFGGEGVGFALLGIIEYVGDETTGVQMMNLAQASIQAVEVYSWLQDPAKSMKPLIARFQPDVALVVLGSNDLSNGGKTPAQTVNDLGGIALELQDAVPDIDVVFVMRPNPAPEFSQLTELVMTNAPLIGARYLDLRNEPRLADPSLYVADGVHFNATGDTVMASVMSDYLKAEKVVLGAGISEEEVLTLISENTASREEVNGWVDDGIVQSMPIVQGLVGDMINNSLAENVPVTQAMIDDAIANNAAVVQDVVNDTILGSRKTKLMTWTCGGLDQVVALSATSRTSMGARVPVRTLQPSKRWRVKIRNYGTISGAKAALTGKGIIFGQMFGDGSFAVGGTQTLVDGDFTVPGDGSFFYSPWVTEPSSQLSPDYTALIGWGWTTPSNVAVQGMEAKWWFTNTFSQSLDPAYTGQSIQNMYGMPADFQIEYEVETTRISGLWIGDSISAGIVGPPGVSQNSNVLQYWWESWPNQWAENKEAILNNISASGFRAANFADNMDPWTRVDHVGADYDFGVVALGTNDFMNDTVAVFQAKMEIVIQRMRDWCGLAGKPIYLLGPTARGQGNDARRQEMDAWLATKPFNVDGYVNLQTALAALQTSASLATGMTSDGVHPSYTGRDRLWYRALQALLIGEVDRGLPARNNDIFKRLTQAQYNAMAGGRDDDILYLIRG